MPRRKLADPNLSPYPEPQPGHLLDLRPHIRLACAHHCRRLLRQLPGLSSAPRRHPAASSRTKKHRSLAESA
ncbi:hypothetical protein VTO73DRAFT_1683 [Trametes versicolor]